MIVNIGELIDKRRNNRRSHRKKINIIGNTPTASTIEEAKAKVLAIIEQGKKKKKKKDNESK